MTSGPSQRLHTWSRSLGLIVGESVDLPLPSIISHYATVKEGAFNLSVQSSAGIDPNKFNPLSKVTAGNPWTAQYENQNRVNEIKLDVDRTFQEMAFFQNSRVQKALINVLYVFSKKENLQYRQGMNEVCAILFYTVSEGIDALPAEVKSKIVDLEEAREAVCYGLLLSLMMKIGIADFYYTQPVVATDSPASTASPILQRCEKVFDLLAQRDARLHKHLVTNDISPNLFLVRWLRLMFIREYGFSNIMRVWDFILQHVSIADSKPLSFPCVIDYVALAMVLNIRQSLLTSDNAGCFTILLKYPNVFDIGQLLDLAIQLRGSGAPIANPARAVAPARVSASASSRRDKVLSDLGSVIEDLRNSEVAKSVEREIAKLEDLVNFLKPSNR